MGRGSQEIMLMIRSNEPFRSARGFESFGRADSVKAPSVEKSRNAAAPKIRAGKIALPTEHGGWGFLFEPIVAGLAVAFSMAGSCIAVMTIGAFLVRQPLKVLVIDRLGMKVKARARMALLFVVGFGVVFSVGLVGTILTAGPYPLSPFLIVLPLAVTQLYYDFARQGRHLLPELGGAITISASAAAITLAGGLEWPAAIGLGAIFIARLIPSIIYVRERLHLEKGKGFSRTLPIAAHFSALVLVAALAYFRLAPALTVFAMMLLLFRTIEGLSAGRMKMKAMKIGILEVIYGTLTVLSVVIGYHTGF
jgi:hypothetical protein